MHGMHMCNNLILVCVHDYRGVGCIFIEMLTGKPLFPGIKGVYDQLNKIWSVSDSMGQSANEIVLRIKLWSVAYSMDT